MIPAVWGHVSGVVTVVLMLVFIGIWYWAWRPRHRRTFDRLANMPLEDLARHTPDAEASGHDLRRRRREDAAGGEEQESNR
jgi:cytochrome c oxidase cbb3-type subunit 4